MSCSPDVLAGVLVVLALEDLRPNEEASSEHKGMIDCAWGKGSVTPGKDVGII